MVLNNSALLSHFKHLFWLTFPPLLLFIALWFMYVANTELVNAWTKNLDWIGYASLGITSVICWQFGRSRLVYACLLLLLFLPISQWLSETIFDSNFSFVLLSLLVLMFSQDKGLAPINLAFGLFILVLIWLFSWLAIPHIESASQAFTGQLDSTIYQLSPTLRTMATAFDWCLVAFVTSIAFIRLNIKADNTHSALFFSLPVVAVMSMYSEPLFNTVALLSLTVLYCYSVLKDSFAMAFKDELTGIPSRRALMQYEQTLGRKYTVVMSDIDHFKKFNDTYGHDVGDEVLKLVASKLDKVLGGGKTFRFGGEEFVMVFPRKSTSEVVPYVEAVRQTIADYDIALRAKPRPPKPKKPQTKKPEKSKIVKVTSSFGIAERTKEYTDFAGIMKQADIALYAAKKAGRNCVKVAKQ